MMLCYSLYPVKGCVVGGIVVVGREKGEGKREKGEGMNSSLFVGTIYSSYCTQGRYIPTCMYKRVLRRCA